MSAAEEYPRLRVWAIGQSERAEFADSCQLLKQRTTVQLMESTSSAIANPRDGAAADLIVLLQSFAGELSRSDIDRLLKLAPLAPVICLLGTYCEGETRSGRPLPRSHRLFWYNATARLNAGIQNWQAGACPWWSFPTTSSSEECWLHRTVDAANCGADLSPQPMSGRVALFAARQDLAAANMELLTRCGADPVFLSPRAIRQSSPSKFDCGIWDAAAVGRCKPMPLIETVKWAGSAPIISLRTFPRTQHLEADRADGAFTVLPRLIGADDLVWHVAACISRAVSGRISLHDPAA